MSLKYFETEVCFHGVHILWNILANGKAKLEDQDANKVTENEYAREKRFNKNCIYNGRLIELTKDEKDKIVNYCGGKTTFAGTAASRYCYIIYTLRYSLCITFHVQIHPLVPRCAHNAIFHPTLLGKLINSLVFL